MPLLPQYIKDVFTKRNYSPQLGCIYLTSIIEAIDPPIPYKLARYKCI